VEFVNELSPEEREAHKQRKRYCTDCRRATRICVDRKVSTVTWTSRWPQRLPPRRFVNAKIRVIEEEWLCRECHSMPSLLMDFEFIGKPEEIVSL
jgi:hypothetical protein